VLIPRRACRGCHNYTDVSMCRSCSKCQTHYVGFGHGCSACEYALCADCWNARVLPRAGTNAVVSPFGLVLASGSNKPNAAKQPGRSTHPNKPSHISHFLAHRRRGEERIERLERLKRRGSSGEDQNAPKQLRLERLKRIGSSGED